MAITINQTPAEVSLAQSPIVFSVIESPTGSLLSSSYQYVCDLTYWFGSSAVSGTVDYTLNKFPNINNYGIFDLSKIINSVLSDAREESPSNVLYYNCRFYSQYQSASLFYTSSKTTSSTFKALDGYAVFPEPIGQEIEDKTIYWPIMTDGPATQSVFIENTGTFGIYTGYAGEAVMPNEIWYTIGNGIYDTEIIVSSSALSSQQIQQVPLYPSSPGFPIAGFETSSNYYSIQAYYRDEPLAEPVPVSDSIRFELKCEQKYPNVRIKWKNRFGQYDYFNFDMVNRQSFSTTTRTYQPQLGSWDGSSLGYQQWNSSVLNYISDSTQAISVNSDWVSEDYNDIFKQLMVSDEIYWIYDEPNQLVRPITIATNTIQFKTGVVDKLIQYKFDFNYGQGYKLII
jgi:hypothetical protein